jgi:hypothetical protein
VAVSKLSGEFRVTNWSGVKISVKCGS